MPPRSSAYDVERLEVEVGAVARLRVGAGLEPHPLADLVADRLARPAEVAVDLAAHEVARGTALRSITNGSASSGVHVSPGW